MKANWNQTLLPSTALRALCVRTTALVFALAALNLSAKTDVAPLSELSGKAQRDAQLADLDSAFQTLSDRFYHHYVTKHEVAKYTDMRRLRRALAADPADVEHVVLVRNNLDLLLKDTSTPAFKLALERLYRHNDTATIKRITDYLDASRDGVAQSENYLLLAKYYHRRNHWRGLRDALSEIDDRNLEGSDAHYFYLLNGYSLQSQKEHRKAAKYYQKIPRTSPYYAFAKLNEGTAYLRQGWWTEANIEFERAIRAIEDEKGEELKNRLLVVLGYSQIHHEFYRDARNTLRKVGLETRYTNKALMGLGLTAAHQKDFSGALNAFTLLTQKPEKDLSVDEGYLLIPYAHEQLRDTARASAGYRQAIRYYQARLADLGAAKAQLQASQGSMIATTMKKLDGEAPALYGSKSFIPGYILENYHTVVVMSGFDLEDDLRQSMGTLKNRYEAALKEHSSDNIALRESMLNSYLSQAKYGVAKLYDK